MKLGSTKPPFTMKPSRSAVLRCDGKFVVSGQPVSLVIMKFDVTAEATRTTRRGTL
jgi:hypothetical protein